MHLTDEELREFDNKNTDSITSEISAVNSLEDHFTHCQACQTRLTNLQAFRKQLTQDTSEAIPKFKWQDIERVLGLAAETNSNILPPNVFSLKQKVKRLQTALVSIAASLLVVLLLSYFATQSEHDLELKLAAVINENKLLQKELGLFQGTNLVQTVAYQTTQIKIQEIDQKIQQSYLENLDTEQKIDLWNQRKEVLIHTTQKVQPRTVFTI